MSAVPWFLLRKDCLRFTAKRATTISRRAREAGVIAGGLACALADPYSRVVGASGGVYCVHGIHVANFVLNFEEMRRGLCNHWVTGRLGVRLATPRDAMARTVAGRCLKPLGDWATGYRRREVSETAG